MIGVLAPLQAQGAVLKQELDGEKTNTMAGFSGNLSTVDYLMEPDSKALRLTINTALRDFVKNHAEKQR